MARNEGFVTYVTEELLGDIPGITAKPMFGGYGIYKEGVVFAMIIHDTLYFKTGENNRSDFKKRGSKPFEYTHKSGKIISMSYYELPEEIMENKAELPKWINKSLAVKNKKK